MAMAAEHIVQVAVAAPLRRVFDYRSPTPLPRGVRVRVPFGRKSVIGVVVSNRPPSTAHRLKTVSEALDAQNPFGERLLELLLWAARYYHHPLGEVLHAALPGALRAGQPLIDPTRRRFVRARRLDDAARAQLQSQLNRAPLQKRIYAHLCAADWLEVAQLNNAFANCASALRALVDKGAVDIEMRHPAPTSPTTHPGPKPNAAQQHAIDAIDQANGRFESFLLHGITGSGKTEVYLHAAQRCIDDGRQALLLVPEIALTPQLVARVRERLGDGVCVLHSGLPPSARRAAWWRAHAGDACAVLGTRSAVFAPLPAPGLLIVDEEHDLSYKQQDGFRYHARDLAIKRAQLESIPIVLGSATPSMETRHNAARGRCIELTLAHRAGGATLPRITSVNLTQHRAPDGVSAPLLRALRERLARGEQSVVFINRRGFAPLAQCAQCGAQVGCTRCDARLTYHRPTQRFQCHHCGASRRAELTCAQCGQDMRLIGVGTQRLEKFLGAQFPDAHIARLDSDQIKNADALERELESIASGQTNIIIGTQLIAKGHDFSRVTLVGVVNSDQGLYSADFRAAEYLFRQLTQVAGRAGRGDRRGEVLVQTAHPDHPMLQHLCAHDFDGFAEQCLAERRAANFPPFSHLALWRAESTAPNAAKALLREVAALGEQLIRANANQFAQIEIMDAVVSPMEKRAGRHRAQLLVRSANRAQLHALLNAWVTAVENHRNARRARWSIDVDPMEMF